MKLALLLGLAIGGAAGLAVTDWVRHFPTFDHPDVEVNP